MREITVDATLENLVVIQSFIEGELEVFGASMKAMMQTSIAVEEIYVNIAHYAYNPEIGEATVRCTVEEEPLRVIIQFLDSGKPYNPLLNADVDITLSAEERNIGGLGILLVKNSMDEVEYSYEDNKNILTLKKKL